jgi:hypothetical protein
MKILVIDQCSGSKEFPDSAESYGAEEIDESTLEELRTRDETVSIRARDLYTGRQQRYITQAIEQLEVRAGDSVDRYFISAGFGVVDDTEELPPYNVTFNDYPPEEIERRASKLGIERDLLELLDEEYDLVFLALGSEYYRTFDLSTVLGSVSSDTWVVCFNCASEAAAFDNAVALPARTEQAKQQETIVVALKGKYLQNFADHRSHGAQVTSPEDIETYCTTAYETQSDLGAYGEE